MVGFSGKGRKSLGYKLNVATAFLAVVVCLLVSLYYQADMRERIKDQARHEMVDLLNSLNLALETRASRTDLQRVVLALSTKESITRMSLVSEDRIVADNHSEYLGRTVAEVYGDNIRKLIGDALTQSNNVELHMMDGIFHQSSRLYLISPEVQRLRPYALYVAYNTAPLEVEARADLIEFVVIQSLGFLLLLGINTLVQQRVVLAPISAIRRQIVADHQREISLESDDEFGLLVDSYNASIKQRIAQEKELEDSRRYIDAVTNVIPVQLAYVDASRCYRFINKRYLQWLEKSEEEVLGHLVADVLPAPIEELVRPYQQRVLEGQQQVFESDIERSGEEVRYIQATYVPDFNGEGEVVGFFACIEDLSRIKANERKIESYAQELEFNNWALMDAREKAEAASRSKADFLACMSHEIRTPMNGVIGILSLLGRTELSIQQRHYVSVASSSAESLLTLLNDILDFSKIESGKFEIEEIPFDLVKLLDEFVQPLAIRAEDKGLKMLLDVSGIHVRWVRGDPSRLRQVLVNLVGNAIKFTEMGWIAIRVQAQREASSGLRLDVSIEDTGIGIPKDKQDQLFSPFTQADSSTTRHFGGTGLGLSIARRLCELMDGDIKVISAEDAGSTFKFHIHLKPDVANHSRSWPPVLPCGRVFMAGELGASERMLMELFSGWKLQVKSFNGREGLEASLGLQESDWLIYSVPQHLASINAELDWLSDLGQQQHCQVLAVISHQQQLSLQADAQPKCQFICRPPQTLALVDILSGGGVEEEHRFETAERHFEDSAQILLVEDNKVNQMVALGMLRNLGLHHVDVAFNGLEALSALQHKNYDIILMDCLMPEMDGYQATVAIRLGDAGEQCKDIPIIAMTANAMKGDKEQCLEAGMNDYVAKPLEIGVLSEVLQRYLSAQHMQPSDEEGEVLVTPEELFDRHCALQLMSGDEQLLGDILTVFVEEMMVYREAFETAMDRKDFAAVRTAVHSIKGAASNLCMGPLAAVAKEMEVAARNLQWEFLADNRERFLATLQDTLEQSQVQSA
ncbi:hybrid sensor histidine kinase/response regulator [Shewanella khirikhana]|uniref:histidine kinase n=1 Tax=Shewanella khirikhana TaxID=1965282 RepID=A0ABM7DST7_9GAMM|nr:ATP-binding protein [Shewanella khirikhana]AZQ12774.1 Signal transduction histidine-protein kinase BarA [Shewanella khirikhana]